MDQEPVAVVDCCRDKEALGKSPPMMPEALPVLEGW